MHQPCEPLAAASPELPQPTLAAKAYYDESDPNRLSCLHCAPYVAWRSYPRQPDCVTSVALSSLLRNSRRRIK
jgi:hypothetical protein